MILLREKNRERVADFMGQLVNLLKPIPDEE